MRILTIAAIVLLGACSEKGHSAMDSKQAEKIVGIVSGESKSEPISSVPTSIAGTKSESGNGLAHKGSIFTGNYAILGSQQIRDGEFKDTSYAIHLVGQMNKPRPGFPTDAATMVWLTRKLEPIKCLHEEYQTHCYKELIVDTAEVPANKLLETAIVMPDQYMSCAWNGNPLLALLSKPLNQESGAAFAAWRFDLATERIIPASLNEVNCQTQTNEEALKQRAYEFMTEGWGGEAIRGFATTHDVNGFFHRVGKVLKQEDRLIKHEDNPSVNDELHNYQYDGMTVMAYLARIGSEERVYVNDVVITSPNWPVRYGLIVGAPRKKIEETLGRSMSVNSPSEWIYGDGPAEITYSFDKNDKVISIKWHETMD